MATIVSFQLHSSLQTSLYSIRPNPSLRICRIHCRGNNPTTDSPNNQESKPENAVLKVAWYGSELLGIAASFLRPPSDVQTPVRAQELTTDVSGAIPRPLIVETIKEDFRRSYFVTGNLTLEAYEEQCEFADPAGSFKGLRRFKRNCTNFGSLVDKSNMKLTKWEDFEDKGIGHWKFSCILSFPWRPILSATGYTDYYFDARSGKVCRHVEHWNVPKMALLKQILRPTRDWLWFKKAGGT
ncbi:Nuclear transport factor 2 family protein [Cucumis melo var. makuwa]|uniref:Nuclear transport factor 2 family protein n=2 Tax=Cucumis melo TaxID=3656 RepID=A0A5D3BY85_CUCMM|nr:Nuclear transport factor 2 family protein [Cucumis melo var. makuwa]